MNRPVHLNHVEKATDPNTVLAALRSIDVNTPQSVVNELAATAAVTSPSKLFAEAYRDGGSRLREVLKKPEFKNALRKQFADRPDEAAKMLADLANNFSQGYQAVRSKDPRDPAGYYREIRKGRAMSVENANKEFAISKRAEMVGFVEAAFDTVKDYGNQGNTKYQEFAQEIVDKLRNSVVEEQRSVFLARDRKEQNTSVMDNTTGSIFLKKLGITEHADKLALVLTPDTRYEREEQQYKTKLAKKSDVIEAADRALIVGTPTKKQYYVGVPTKKSYEYDSSDNFIDGEEVKGSRRNLAVKPGESEVAKLAAKQVIQGKARDNAIAYFAQKLNKATSPDDIYALLDNKESPIRFKAKAGSHVEEAQYYDPDGKKWIYARTDKGEKIEKSAFVAKIQPAIEEKLTITKTGSARMVAASRDFFNLLGDVSPENRTVAIEAIKTKNEEVAAAKFQKENLPKALNQFAKKVALATEPEELFADADTSKYGIRVTVGDDQRSYVEYEIDGAWYELKNAQGQALKVEDVMPRLKGAVAQKLTGADIDERVAAAAGSMFDALAVKGKEARSKLFAEQNTEYNPEIIPVKAKAASVVATVSTSPATVEPRIYASPSRTADKGEVILPAERRKLEVYADKFDRGTGNVAYYAKKLYEAFGHEAPTGLNIDPTKFHGEEAAEAIRNAIADNIRTGSDKLSVKAALDAAVNPARLPEAKVTSSLGSPAPVGK